MCQCPALYGCGALYRLFQFRSFHNLQADIRNQLHTFFLYNLTILELYGNIEYTN